MTETAKKIAIAGVTGRMGKAAVQAVIRDSGLQLVGGFAGPGNASIGHDLGSLIEGGGETGILVSNDFQACVAGQTPDVLLDVTRAGAAFENARAALNSRIAVVIGTSGLTDEQIAELSRIAESKKVAALVVPNFSVGAVLMMEFARQAALLFNDSEIVEMHHTKKADAPSGTAMHTLKKMSQVKHRFNQERLPEKELLPGTRGALVESGLRVHSLRLPGLISHQEVYFGSAGELLKITHDSFNTDCFVKGILLSLHEVLRLDRLVIGLEHVLPLS